MGNSIEETKQILKEEGTQISSRLLVLLEEIENKKISTEEARILADEALQVAKISGIREEILKKIVHCFELACSVTFLL